MGKIIELSPHISNQIAAGEVVERPSSVIKELIENAIDASASNIEVRIKDGGFSYMVVQDDGVGMDESDVTLAIKRYATSKLTEVSDLDRLFSFGFRGEALPSIASISQMTIISRPKEQTHGTKAVIEAGVIREIAKAGANLGTRIEVRDLFYNVPARLKFAKSKRIETVEIERLVKAFAFVHGDVSFRLFVDDQLTFSVLKTATILQRALSLFGSDCEGHLYHTSTTGDLLSIDAVVAAPMAQRRDTRGLIFFVNNRLVNDRKLLIAVKTAFQSLIEVGFYPVAALKIEIAPDEVDVNVHPRKAEVRFRNERGVISEIITGLTNFLAKTPWLSLRGDVRAPIIFQKPIYQNPPVKTERSFDFLIRPERMPSVSNELSFKNEWANTSKPLLLAQRFRDLRVIGQVSLTYLLFEGDDGLVIVDQHAAHERVMYEKYKKRFKETSFSTQLLIPITVELDSSSLALFADYQNDLNALGIIAELMDDRFIIVRSIPDFLHDLDVNAFIKNVLSDLAHHTRATAAEEMIHDLCASLACHSSIRAGLRLNLEEIENLMNELDGIDFSAHCPHGRPIVKSINNSEMKKWFDRP